MTTLQIFNVKMGACALLVCDDGSTMLIDAGSNADTGWEPGTYLRRRGIKHLNFLAITNYDEDHVSGLPNLHSNVSVGYLLRNPTVDGAAMKLLKSTKGIGAGMKLLSDKVDAVPAGEPPQFPIPWLTVWNSYPFFKDENDLSMALHLSINGVGFLFPGDLEGPGWTNLLANSEQFRNMVKATDVLVASHHGRASGLHFDLFDKYACKPKLVVISDDYHQYDTQATCAYYGSKCSGIDGFRGGDKRFVLTTRSDGDITFTTNQTGVIVS